MVLEKTGSITKLEAFLATNKCHKGTTANARSSMEFAGVKPKPGATYISISCRYRDLRAQGTHPDGSIANYRSTDPPGKRTESARSYCWPFTTSSVSTRDEAARLRAHSVLSGAQ